MPVTAQYKVNKLENPVQDTAALHDARAQLMRSDATRFARQTRIDGQYDSAVMCENPVFQFDLSAANSCSPIANAPNGAVQNTCSRQAANQPDPTGALDPGEVANNGDDPDRINATSIELVVACFTPGTLIATPKGEVPVELLRAGDRVVTRDDGIQEIRWTGHKALDWHELNANPHLRPILVRQGSLGNGLPERDIMVSPNHRLLVANDRTAIHFDENEVLVAAKHLVANAGVKAVESLGTTYIHFMFDRHEVVLSNGAWTESFQPGDFILKGMGNSQRTEIFDLFPELKTEVGMQNYTAARKSLNQDEARLLGR